MRNVVAYIRVSTDGQFGDDKFGLDAQREQIINYCAKNDMNILKWYSDEGESGAKCRPGFDEIIYGEVTNPPYEAVVVAKSDRVARDINVYFYYQGTLLRKNIELISICEDFGQFGVFANALKMFTLTCAEMERENINKRTSAGRSIKSARGGYSGGRPPYGYRAANHSLEIVSDEAEIVRTVFRMKDTEGKTYKNICDYLNSLGKTNRSGTKFSISTVQVIYENKKVYQGFYRYGKNAEWVKGVQEPILRGER
ncbi:MAG: recombinase family protein [Oscillospiraceae bacterium]|nr:recombinase family protein [Oscillospiraceae bacterium]